MLYICDEMNKPIKIGIVDDHQIVVDGLLALLKDSKNISIVFFETNPVNVLSILERTSIDILITDIMMPEMPGNVLVKRVKDAYPETRILALSMSADGDLVNEMINDVDISGYALKNIGKEDLIEAIEKIANGGIYFSKEVIEELGKSDIRNKKCEAINLTDREIEIIRLIEKEYNNKKIAETLFISERTVETHRKNIFRKTQTSSALGIVKYAYEHKLIN